MSKSELQRLCDAKGVKIASTYGARLPYDKLDKWQREAHGYTVVIRYGKRRMTLDFFMGQAHTSEPKAADVLGCILLDTNACDQSFEQWASDLGFDVDSRNAKATYDACVKQGKALRRLLGEDFDAFASAEH